jgi:ElaB/YqjD/DUF883 family membrane-anchored ribosome-binding protein
MEIFQMASATKSRRRESSQPSFDAIIDDLGALKRDFARLMEQMKSGAVDGAGKTAEDLLDQLNERASELYDRVSEQGESSVKAISRHVEERPITSLLVAFGVGVIASRLLSR